MAISILDMDRAQLGKALTALAAEVGAATYRRRNPTCEPAEARAWGIVNARCFADEALTALARMALEEMIRPSCVAIGP